MSELHISSTDYLYFFYNLIRLTLQFFLNILRNSQHRRGTEGVTGVNAQRVNIFNEADGDHVVLGVTDNFQLQFFPSQNGFFYQNLSHQTGLQTSGTYGLQFFYIINQAAAGTAHGVSRTQNNRITQFVRNGKGFIHTVSHFTSCHLNTQTVHGVLKLNTVFATLNGIYLNTDYFYVIFIQNTFFCQLRTEIQS